MTNNPSQDIDLNLHESNDFEYDVFALGLLVCDQGVDDSGDLVGSGSDLFPRAQATSHSPAC